MDATTLGALVTGAAVVIGAVVAHLGKRAENALTGYSSLTDNLQEERDRLDRQVTERDARIAQIAADRATDQAELARLRAIIIQLGGDPS